MMPAEDVDISFARSGGAGGQNVNKVNTKADIRLNVDKVTWLDDEMKEALRKAVRSLHRGPVRRCKLAIDRFGILTVLWGRSDRKATASTRRERSWSRLPVLGRRRKVHPLIFSFVYLSSATPPQPSFTGKVSCRDNVEDAIGKLQSFLDDAALAVQPIEEDPVKKKKLLKQCVTDSDMARVISRNRVHATDADATMTHTWPYLQAEEGQREAPRGEEDEVTEKERSAREG